MSEDADDALLGELAALLGPRQEPPPEVLHAARESQVGTLDHQIKWSQEFELLDGEATAARAALKQAWTEQKRAVVTYHVLQSELLDDPVYL